MNVCSPLFVSCAVLMAASASGQVTGGRQLAVPPLTQGLGSIPAVPGLLLDAPAIKQSLRDRIALSKPMVVLPPNGLAASPRCYSIREYQYSTTPGTDASRRTGERTCVPTASSSAKEIVVPAKP